MFEIEDFTCATPWERLIASVEDKFREWGVGAARNHHHSTGTNANSKHFKNAGPGTIKSLKPPRVTAASSNRQCTISYQNRDFSLEYFWIPIDSPNAPPAAANSGTGSAGGSSGTPATTSSGTSTAVTGPSTLSHDEKEKLSLAASISRLTDHTLPAHHIAKWFGCSRFIRLMPAADRNVSNDEALELLSSLAIASSNVSCTVPLFVSVHDTWKHVYLGRIVSPYVIVRRRVAFRLISVGWLVVLVRRTGGGGDVWFDVRISDDSPPALRHLSGLTDYFTDRVLSTVWASAATRPQTSPDPPSYGIFDCRVQSAESKSTDVK